MIIKTDDKIKSSHWRSPNQQIFVSFACKVIQLIIRKVKFSVDGLSALFEFVQFPCCSIVGKPLVHLLNVLSLQLIPVNATWTPTLMLS